MDLLSAIAFGFLQGIFEWLPISSQGNIMGLLSFLGTNPQEALKIAIFLHIGTLLAATLYFRKEIQSILKWKNKEDKKLGRFVIFSTLATAVTAVPSFLILEELLGFGIAFALILIAILLIITGLLQLKNNKNKIKEIKNKKESISKLEGKKINSKNLSFWNSILVGLGQGFSVLPGISRSGITTSILLFRNFEPEEAFRVSFLMSIPAVLLGEIAYGLIKGFTINEFAIVALIVAFVIGFFSMDLLIKFARKINFAYFCFVLAIIYLIGFFLLI